MDVLLAEIGGRVMTSENRKDLSRPKDPSLRDTLYVEELIGPETISTMREETIRAFQDHGRIEPRLETDLNDAQYLRGSTCLPG